MTKLAGLLVRPMVVAAALGLGDGLVQGLDAKRVGVHGYSTQFLTYYRLGLVGVGAAADIGRFLPRDVASTVLACGLAGTGSDAGYYATRAVETHGAGYVAQVRAAAHGGLPPQPAREMTAAERHADLVERARTARVVPTVVLPNAA